MRLKKVDVARAGVAQLVEQLTCNQQVAGSSPIASSSDIKTVLWSCFQAATRRMQSVGRVARVAKGGGL